MAKKVSNAWLRRQYKRINRRFFDNKLPKNTRVRFERSYFLGHTGTIGEGRHERPDIVISKRLRFSDMLVGPTLVHEMVHVEHPEWNRHGPRFERRMIQLINKGAFRFWL